MDRITCWQPLTGRGADRCCRGPAAIYLPESLHAQLHQRELAGRLAQGLRDGEAQGTRARSLLTMPMGPAHSTSVAPSTWTGWHLAANLAWRAPVAGIAAQHSGRRMRAHLGGSAQALAPW